jgi:gliding motility-associated-like protein
MKLCLVLFFLLSHAIPGFTQNYYNNWYFGHNAGLSFNTSPPTALAGGQINTPEGTASISNSAGNLLFYTDGVTVWGRNHAVMPNGTGLNGHPSSSQSALIVPMPGASSKYYLFTTTDHMGSGELSYSIIDMTMNGGIGDVDPAKKNVVLTSNQTEKLVAANSPGCGIWIITHERNTNQFEARLVTATGIGAAVYSHTGSVHGAPVQPNNINNLTGVMKVSKNSRKLGLATLARIIELFDFDPATGILSNPVALLMSAPAQGYGVCFSPDNSKFYVTASQGPGYEIYQYDISSNTAANIIASKTLVGAVSTSVFIVGDMALGPDGKIYCARPGIPFLAVIPNPDLAAPLCGLNVDGQFLSNSSASGLPNEIRVPVGHIELELGPDTTLCPGDVLTLQVPPANAYLWSTGATTSSINITSAGEYWVHVTSGNCSFSDTIHVLFATPQVDLGNDTTVCAGQALVLDAGTAGTGNTFLWSTGATTPLIYVQTAGQYSVTVSHGNCSTTSSVTIAFTALPVVNLGTDITVCEGQQVSLSAGTADTYLWSTGATSAGITTNLSGRYWVKEFIGNCANADTVLVTIKPLPAVPFVSDTTVCQQQELTLDAGIGNRYLWSTGDTTGMIHITSPGPYWVKVNYYGSCDTTYTIDVASKSCDCELYVPTAFTPNGDSRNDVLRPLSLSDCDFFDFAVYNRYGQKVFESKDISKGWDGKLNGVLQSTGVFAWQIIAGKGTQKRQLKGTVLLIR